MRLLNKVKMSKLWIFVFCVGFVGPSLGQLPAVDGIWTTKSPMQRARIVLSSSAVDGKIYAIGGGPDNPATAGVEEYDPATDTWTWKTDMPTARSSAASSVVNGKIYVIGGWTRYQGQILSTVEQYDPATDTWTTKANMPTARGSLSCSVVDGKIYAIGGARTNTTALTTVEQYDPATDTWTSKADMPTARVWPSASAVNGRIYVIGGSPGGGQLYVGLSTVEEYDPATDTWTPKAGMPTARTLLSTSAVNGRVYAIGGDTTAVNGRFSTVEEYDPATDTWTPKADMPTARSMLTTSVVNGKIYAIGGSTGNGPQPVATMEVYDPYPLNVDFNGDYEVDIEDLALLIEHWGQDDPMYDIAPRPFGDGVVDIADLELLMSYWGQEMDDPHLLAHWMLDEIEGNVAYDSAAQNDGIVLGNPVWQPGGGQVDGALEFDGIDDVIVADPVLNPEDGPFSVSAWIKDGTPGQVIISQQGAANWLQADINGALMTDLALSGGRTKGVSLSSETVITDGNWHRIGFTWDGTNRILYVDDIEVARDTLDGLNSADGGLRIGAGNDLAEGSFWSGMIDDVRIYDRVVTP